jgi:hypothetical protein
MFWKLVSRLTGQRHANPRAVTPERLQHFFDWSKASGYIGTSIPHRVDLAGNITIEPAPTTYALRKDLNGLKAGHVIHNPARIAWTRAPRTALVGLIDGKVVIKYSDNRGLWQRMPLAGPIRAGLIAGYFEDWYEFLDLPDEIARLRAQAEAKAAKQRPGEGKLQTIRRYLMGEIDLDALSTAGTALFWVDWRESDDDIVAACEDRLASGKLSAEFVPNAESADLIITYGAKSVKVPYHGPNADRDTTLLTLNKVISGTYQIRFATDSKGSDTLAFLPLKTAEWKALDRDYAEAVATKFHSLTEAERFFG